MYRLDGGVDAIEGVHHLLDVGFVHLGEEAFNSVLVLKIMEHNKSLSGSSHKCRNKPLIELVHDLEVHVGGPEHVLIHQVEGSMGDELVEVPVVVLPHLPPGGGELYLEQRIVIMPNNHEVVSSRHQKTNTKFLKEK